MLNKIIYTILGFGFAFIFFPRASHEQTIVPAVSGAFTAAVAEQHILPAPEQAMNIPAPILTARAALAVDLDSGSVLYSKNLDAKLPIASLTKLMTAIVVIKKTALDEIVTIENNDKEIVGTSIGLTMGERLTVRDLLKAMLIPSSNDAALALGRYVSGSTELFAQAMNEEAKALGLTGTYFSNPVGWDFDESHSNASDLIRIVKEFTAHSELADIVKIKETLITSTDGVYTHQLTTTNKLLLENPEVVGIKTGFTSKALGNLIVEARHNGRRVVTVVLGSENREDDSRKLLGWVKMAYKW